MVKKFIVIVLIARFIVTSFIVNLRRCFVAFVLAAAPLGIVTPVWAQGAAPSTNPPQGTPAPTSQEARQAEAKAALHAAFTSAAKGPSDVALLDEAHLHLPKDMVFVPSAPAARLLRAWGNKVNSDPVGLVLGTHNDDDWTIVVRYVKAGYIKDDDAKDWNADDLLKSIREGNDEANDDRRARGFPELELVGWIVPPTYDAATHRLVSSLAQRVKNAGADEVEGVNYNTYALGRDGYFTLDLLTDRNSVQNDKVHAEAVLAGLDYDQGHRYTDFNASTDHIAAYGLAALLGAVAVKKLGLLALAGVFFLKFAKLGAVAVVAIGALMSKLFRRRNKTAT
jgi:uncharacterized membrane-anchored protein